MAKRLVFTADQAGKDRFQFIYQGFLLGAPQEGLKGIEVNRRAFRVMDKLELISEHVEGTTEEGQEPKPLYYPTGDAIRALVEDGGEILLDEAEVKMIRDHMNEVGWRPALAKGVVDADDFLANAPEAEA